MSLLASFMKLNTKLRIDQKNFELTCLVQQYNRIQDEISIMTQVQNNMKGAWDSITNGISSISQSIFNASISATQTAAVAAAENYTKVLKAHNNDENNSDVIKAKKAMTDSKEAAEGVSKAEYATFQASQSGLAFMNKSVNSVFQATQDAQAAELSRQGKQIDLEKGAVETELKNLNAQYDAYVKLEDKEAKDSAPNFGIG